MTIRTGVDMGPPSASVLTSVVRLGNGESGAGGPFVTPRPKLGAWQFSKQPGFQSRGEHPMQVIEVTQNVAVTISVFMRDVNTDKGLPGLASFLTVTSKKVGAAFATIAPSITDRGNGWYDLAFLAAMVDTLGPTPLRIFTSGGAGAIDNNENILNVIAVNKNDAVHFGISALPNVASGSPGAVALNTDLAGIPALILDAARSSHLVLGSVGEGIALSAALLQGNFYIDNVTPSSNGPTAQRLRCWTSAAAMAGVTPGGSGQGEFATFLVTTTYTGPSKVATHKVVQQ